ARNRCEIEVSRVEHHLDPHQHVHRVAAGEDAQHAEGEEGGGDHQVVREGDHASFFRRTIMAAPMSATSSRIEAASKGSRNGPMNISPMFRVVGAGVRGGPVAHSVWTAMAVRMTKMPPAMRGPAQGCVISLRRSRS